MIIDIINKAGEKAYFKDTAGNINLAQSTPSVATTPQIGKGQQHNVSGIEFYFEGNDLSPLLNSLEDDGNGNLIRRNRPLFSVTVCKEILPGLFADPYKSRIHSLSGFQDFKRGTFENCDVFNLNNKPTLVSLGTDKCSWKSAIYALPEDVSLDKAYWEIPSAKNTPPTAFRYSLKLYAFDSNNNLLNGGAPVVLANNLNPAQPRIKTNINLQKVRSYQFELTADVKHDSTLTERIITDKADTIGRPLLEGIYLVEPVQTKYDFYSLQEFISECSDYELFAHQGLPMKKITATLGLSAVLVHSTNANPNNNDNEFIQLQIHTDQLKIATARIISMEQLKID
ncbi:MAG: hypothetical protein GC181_12630 [Bacteroidetes bacterium]|nr:hypothetical protein [Bacteroidota bacterium]